MPHSQQTAPLYSHAQIHARACIHCDRTDGKLLADGHIRTETWPGEYLVWPVVACAEHGGAEA